MPKSSTATANGQQKTKRTKKDKSGPKRACSSYMHFANDYRPQIVANNPDIKFQDVGKELGARWKSLTAEEKRPYEDMAEKDKARYVREKAEYDAQQRAAM